MPVPAKQPENLSGDLLAVYGTPETGARKAPDKAPEGKMMCFEVKSGLLVGASAGGDGSKKRRFLSN